MKRYIKLFSLSAFAIMVISGCSSKNQTITKIEKNKKIKIANKIKLSNSNNKFKVYINEDDKLQFICSTPFKCSYYKKELHSNKETTPDEDYFYLNKKGYKPRISYKRYGTQCGSGSMFGLFAFFGGNAAMKSHNSLNYNKDVCNSRYSKLESTQIIDRILFTIPTIGTVWLTSGNMHKRIFDYNSFRESLAKSKVEFFRNKLINLSKKYKLDGGFDVVYLEKGDIDDSLEDKYKLIINDKVKKTGVVFLDYDTSDFISLIVFDKYKDKHITKNISNQISDLLKDAIKSDIYHLKHGDITPYIPKEITLPILPVIPKLTKSEFEKKANFKKRVENAVLTREEKIRELQRKYSLDVFERNAYIDNLQKGFENYIVYKSEEKNELVGELKENIEFLSKLLFLENVSGYDAKEFQYDAETEKMYFTIYSLSNNFSQKVFAKMDADNAKEIKMNKSYKIIPNLDYKNGYLKLESFIIEDTENNDEFDIKYTNKSYKPDSIKVSIYTNKEKITPKLSKEFKRFKQKSKRISDTHVTIAYKDVVSQINARVPKWFSSPNSTKVISYGEANSLNAAKANARKDLAYMIKVKVDTSFENTKELNDFKSFKEVKQKTRQSSSIELKSGEYKIYKQEKVEGRWYVALEYTKR